MLRKILQSKSSDACQSDLDTLRIFSDKIDAKEKEIADKKAKLKEEQSRGARITKHRFTV